jgi:hypothetical protein
MPILLCPGYHDPALTDAFMAGLAIADSAASQWDYHIFPAHQLPPYSPVHMETFLREQFPEPPKKLVFISFSAGVVGAIATARHWQKLGHPVTAFFALDGFGVPLGGNFPIHRLSHDEFTHWGSSLLGTGSSNFYADPPVTHLELWRSPHQVYGYATAPGQSPSSPTTAALFLTHWLTHWLTAGICAN